MSKTVTLSKHEIVVDREEYERLKALDSKSTVSCYSVDKDSELVYHLDNGIQEEIMLPMGEVVQELEGSDEFFTFIDEVDTTCTDCLLIKAW